jgi:tetratricopeptide (TPR) repeat protein
MNSTARHGVFVAHISLLLAGLGLSTAARGEKVLIYDEDRGVISVEREELEKQKGEVASKAKARPPVPTVRDIRLWHDFHVGRKKDPPELYFKSGLQYFRDHDYLNALKNFMYARDVEPLPKYHLWVGKTYRQLEQTEKMLSTMAAILKKFPESDVADDALFEVAFHYQKKDDYHTATEKYAELAEQYPFGVSFSSSQEFLQVSRQQRQVMRAEMVSALKMLGYKGKTPAEAYRQFQKAFDLEPHGELDQATVRAVKKEYERKLVLDAKLAAELARIRRSTIWVLVAAVALGLNLWFAMAIRSRVKQRKSQLANLESILTDLDVKAL